MTMNWSNLLGNLSNYGNTLANMTQSSAQQSQQSQNNPFINYLSSLNNGQNIFAGGNSGGGYSPQAGYGFKQMEFEAAQQTYLQNLKAKQQMELQSAQTLAEAQFRQADNALKSQLAQQQITHEQYMQQRDLAQKESEFARNLAQRQLEFKHQQEMDQAQLHIAQASEMRNERELQARLAANPQDWVAYEFYKRQLGAPGTISDTGNKTSAAGTVSDGSQAGTPGVNTTSPTMLNGQPYEAAPPAYSDKTAQSIATALFNPTGAGYNPNLTGTGVFGTTIGAPNTLTRREAGNLSDSELGMLSGLLRAGIQMGDKRVALDPQDWFKQAQTSWAPTLGESGGQGTQYS